MKVRRRKHAALRQMRAASLARSAARLKRFTSTFGAEVALYEAGPHNAARHDDFLDAMTYAAAAAFGLPPSLVSSGPRLLWL